MHEPEQDDAGNIEQHGHRQLQQHRRRWRQMPVINRDRGIGGETRRQRRHGEPGDRPDTGKPRKHVALTIDQEVCGEKCRGPYPGRAARQKILQDTENKGPERRHQVGPDHGPEVERHEDEQRRRDQSAEKGDRKIGDHDAQDAERDGNDRGEEPASHDVNGVLHGAAHSLPVSEAGGSCALALGLAGGDAGGAVGGFTTGAAAWTRGAATGAGCGGAAGGSPAAVAGSSFAVVAGGCSVLSLKSTMFTSSLAPGSARSATRYPLTELPTTVPVASPGGSKPPSPELTT